MKIIDAFWEKRNLGVTCKEISVTDSDSAKDLSDVVSVLKDEYIVVKCPSARLDLYEELTKNGFYFVETAIHVTHNLKNITLSPIQKRINDAVSYELMEEADYSQMENEIRKGLFYTDRVYLDNHFSKEQAAERYVGWLSDEKKRGTQFYKLIYKGNAVGFFVMKEIDDGVFYPFLAGMYKGKSNAGLGSVFNYKPIEEAKKRNGKMISTFISTNNSNTLRSHVAMGFDFNEVTYVFVKHNCR